MAKAKKKTIEKKSAKKTTAKKSSDWPYKRNVLFRPDRMVYVRKLIKNDGCVFCLSAKNPMSVETLCVYKSEYSQIVINKYPYNNGHLLVLPLDHIGDLLNLSPERFNDLHRTIRLGVEAAKAVYQPTGYNIGLNNGTAAGAGIPDHLHYHIVPRWGGDLNFFPLIAETKIVIEKVEDSYNKFLDFFEKVKE